MRIVEINSVNYGSTGKIMIGIAKVARERGHKVWTFNEAGKSQKKNISGNYFIGNRYERNLSNILNYYIGNNGAFNILGTYKFLKELDRINPDIIHFHNLHSNFINLEMLFNYINKRKIKVVWTLHDCWPFTGHCPCFDIVQCEKWKTGCYACPMTHEYPATMIDMSKSEYIRKKKIFTSIKDMVIVTPSQWLSNLVGESFLGKYDIRVIPNGIDLNIFYPRRSDFRDRYNIKNKFVILGVAFSWGYRKGLDRFERLSEELDDRFQIVLVGLSDKEVKSKRIICINKTDNQGQLAEIYSAADVLLNPTREDNFPTVNVEALACGIPVLSYGAGGSAEAFNEKSGMVISDQDVACVLDKMYHKPFEKKACLERGKMYNQLDKFDEYVRLYKSI